MTDSCLVSKLSHYIDLDEPDRSLITRLEKRERDFPRRHVVREVGDEARMLYAVRDGWLFSSTTMRDGRRQVLQFHYPGDIIGIPDLAFSSATVTLETLTPVCLCPFPKTALDDVFVETPRLAALLFNLGMVDHVVLLDRLRAISRFNAQERISHLILEVVSRLRITHPEIGAHFELPLNQNMIGDAVGLTNVYVSRSFKGMEETGLIRRRGRMLEILDEDDLRRRVGFEDRYFSVDTEWLPRSA